MSFGMIFSIFIIIMILAVAIYAIVKFMDIGSCARAGLFYDDLQGEIDRAWNSGPGTYLNENFEITVDKAVDNVCFGEVPPSPTGLSTLATELRKKFEDYPEERNIFLDPPENICGELSSKKLQHVNISEFFCKKVDEKGKIIFSITKLERESLVNIKPDPTS